MNNYFVYKYSSIRDNILFLKKIKYYATKRFIITNSANALVPLFFKITNFFTKKKLTINENNLNVIVSLTTFPTRINRVWIVIECMLRQTYKPDRIILWLSKEQFECLEKLPKSLLKLQSRGLEIKFCNEDLRSHKKYFYSIKKYPCDILITVDDDFIYSSFLIEDLMKLHLQHPNEICCLRALEMKLENNQLFPYNNWTFHYGQSKPTFNLFYTSGGGTLFPPESLHNDLLNKDLFMKICKYADDVWLNFMSQMNQTKVVKPSSNYELSIPLYFKKNRALSSINVDDGLNDEQIDNLRKYYINNEKIDPLVNLFKK